MVITLFSGIIPEPLDPVSVANQVITYLQAGSHRQIDPAEPVLVFLAYCFDDAIEGEPDETLSNKAWFFIFSITSWPIELYNMGHII